MTIRLCCFFAWLCWHIPGFAQTTHPLLVEMQEKARALDYGSWRLVAKENYPYSSDTLVYRAGCAFARFEHFDGKPGIRFEVQIETNTPRLLFQQHVVFDGQIKYDFKGDSLVMMYDSKQLGDEYTMRGLQHFFFIPLLLHPGQVQKFLGPDKYLGTPPYQTRGDTIIDNIPCHWVGADWALDTAALLWQHIRFGISKNSGLPVYFSHVDETKSETPQKKPHRRTLEIRVEEWSPALPLNSFYVDWFGLPPGIEVKQFYDCYHKETLRPRNQPGL